jgi:hypothetical protein
MFQNAVVDIFSASVFVVPFLYTASVRLVGLAAMYVLSKFQNSNTRLQSKCRLLLLICASGRKERENFFLAKSTQAAQREHLHGEYKK